MSGPLTKVEFAVGVVKDDSPLASEGGWIDADKVRFKQGKPQTIGGWTALSGGTFSGIVRGAHAWADLTGKTWEAFGTAAKLYVESSGTVSDITPNHSEGTLQGGVTGSLQYYPSTNPFYVTAEGSGFQDAVFNCTGTATGVILPNPTGVSGQYFTVYNLGAGVITMQANYGGIDVAGTMTKTVAAGLAYKFTSNGTIWITAAVNLTTPFETTSGSATVTVNHPQHGLSVGDTVVYSNSSAVGGLTMNGTRTVASVVSADAYTFTHGSTASSTATGGSPVDFIATLSAGNVGGSSTTRPRVWSIDNFGENLLAVPNKGGGGNGGGLYEWQPATAWPELVFGGNLSSSTGWATGTGWSISGGVATKTAGTASNLSQNIKGVLSGGKTYRLTFDVTRSAGTLQFGVNAGTPTAAVVALGAAISLSGSYSRLFRCPSDPSDIVFTGDSTFAGTVDNVSIKLESKAYRIEEAPHQSEAMFVDPNAHVVLLGTVEADGDYNPMLVRWSDQANNRSWIPDGSNLAGESPLQGGGRLVGGVAARSQNVVISDAAAFSMTYTGQSNSVFAITTLGTSCGLVGRHAIAEHDGTVFWWSNNGNFYIFTGAIPQVMDCRLRRDVMTHIAANQGDKIFCGINPAFSEFWYFYPDSRDGTENSRYVSGNWTEQGNWSCGTMAVTSWIPQGVFTAPRGFWTSGTIMQHETGNDANGSALTWYLESGFFDIGDGDRLMAVTKLIPDSDDQVGGVTYAPTLRRYPNAGDITVSSKTATTATEELNFRFMARQVKLRISGSAIGSFWRMGLMRLAVQQGAGR